MEAQTTLIGTDSTVELHPKPAIDLNAAVVINPGNLEHNDPFRLHNSLHNSRFDKLRLSLENRLQRRENFMHSLVKFGSAGFFPFTIAIIDSRY